MSEWLVALDFGTTATAVAVGGGRGRAVVLGDGSSTVPSSVFAESDGRLVVGVEADNEAELRLDAYEPTPKRRVGDGQIRLGERDFSVAEVIGAVLAPVLGEAMQQNNNTTPTRVVLTHPVAWRSRRRTVLAEALSAAGARLGVRFPEPVFVAEPVAAAQWYAHTDAPVPGEFFAVYDLGGGTFDTTVLKATTDGFDVIASGGVDPLGGFDFDAALFDYLGTKYIAPADGGLWAGLSLPGQPDPELARQRRRLQQRVGLLKTGLSTAPDKQIQLPGVTGAVVVTRGEYEALISSQIDQTIGELEDTIADAGLTPEKLTAIYRIGGAARTPLVGAALDRFRVPVKVLDQPKLVVAQGAATPLTTTATPQTTAPSAPIPPAKPQAQTAAPGKLPPAPPPAGRPEAVAASREASLAGVNPDSNKKAETPLTRFIYAVYSIVAITLLIGMVIGIVHFVAGRSTSSHNPSQPAASQNDSPTSANQSMPESAAPSTTQPASGDAAPPTAGVAGKIIMLDPALSGGSDSPLTTQVPDGRGGSADCQRSGSSTVDGYPAHSFIWDTTLRIRAALNAMGARTAMTRGNDSEAGPCVDQRAAMGNALHPNATVSILAKTAWEKERGFFVNYAAPPLNNAQAGPSVQLAQDVAGQMLASGLTPDSAIGQGGIYGLSEVAELNLSQYPAIQIDLGNPQNPTDAQLMETPDGRQKYADAVARGIAAFLTNHPN